MIKRGQEVNWGPGAELLVGVEGAKPQKIFRFFMQKTFENILSCKVEVQMWVEGKG